MLTLVVFTGLAALAAAASATLGAVALVAGSGSILALAPAAGSAALSLAACLAALRLRAGGRADARAAPSESDPEERSEAEAGLAETPPAPSPEPPQSEAAARPRLGGDDKEEAALALFRLSCADAVLTKVPAETESAVFALMDRLTALRDQSRRAYESAEEDGAIVKAASISELSAHANATMARVREALAEMRKHDRSAATGLQALGKELSAGIELLAGIEEITERSRLIAFNMAVEAARIGSQGNGFKVIVNELRNLNDQTADFSKRVSELLGRFKRFNESLVEKSVTDSASVAESVEQGIKDEEAAISSLVGISTACFNLSSEVERIVESMNKDLDGILESLQFQDITRQMVEGAQGIMAEGKEALESLLSFGDDGEFRPDAARIDALRSRLIARTHTRGEREAIQEAAL